jgi:hypothetical protein
LDKPEKDQEDSNKLIQHKINYVEKLLATKADKNALEAIPELENRLEKFK